jgi:L-rhamnose mutarotase
VTERTAFVLRVRPDKIEEYIRAHQDVWPEMLDALRGAGIRNYTIFREGNQMFGYFEAEDLAAAGRYLAQQEVSTRWQDAMAELLERRVPDGGPPALEEIFRLE